MSQIFELFVGFIFFSIVSQLMAMSSFLILRRRMMVLAYGMVGAKFFFFYGAGYFLITKSNSYTMFTLGALLSVAVSLVGVALFGSNITRLLNES